MALLLANALQLRGFLGRSRSVFRLCASPFICVVLLTGAIDARAAEAPRAQREAAVIEARKGDTKTGLAALQALLQKYPDDPRLLADTTIVANWAGEDQFAVSLYAHHQTPKNDGGVVEAAARSSRNLQWYGLAIELYRRAQKLDPERWQPHLGEALVLTDQGDYASADKLMKPLLDLHGNEKDVILGEGYLCSREANFSCSIAMYQNYLVKYPDDIQVRTNMALALSRVGGQTFAEASYTKDVRPAARETDRGLSGAAGGEEVNWGAAYAPTRALQRADSEMALTRLNGVIAASSAEDPVWKAAEYDRLIALFDLRRPQDAVRSYEALKHQGLDVPSYAVQVVAGAYLASRHPETAEKLYAKLLKESPSDGSLWSGLAYSQMERWHPNEALATIDRAYGAAAPAFQPQGLVAPRSNTMRLNLESQAAQMRVDVGLMAEGQRRLKGLLAAAPANENIRWELAASDLSRGWPRRAVVESRIAAGYATQDELPSLASVEINEGAGLRDEVDASIPKLRVREDDSPALKRFLRQAAIERGWQFYAEAAFGWGSGEFVGNSDQHSDTHLYSPWLNNRWRIYGHELSDSGDFGTSTAERTRGSAGVQYSYGQQEAWAELGYDTGTNRIAGNVGGKLSLSDEWTVRAEADSDSYDVPVRALTGNVYGRSVDTDLEWRASELRLAHIGLQRVLFSDGNQRAALSGAWDERMRTTPRLQASIHAEGWASSNSLNENRAYFNPALDFSLGPRASLDWLTWQRYDHSVHQIIEVYVAPYWQQNYGLGDALSVHYGQIWKLREGLGGRCGVDWTSQPYDGVNETRTALSCAVLWGSQ
jgi:biofilm PGA synthesis protein PgaA